MCTSVLKPLNCRSKISLPGDVSLMWQWSLSRCRLKPMKTVLILLAFLTGNSSLEPLFEGLGAQIHTDLSWLIFGRNRTGDLRITQICWVPRSSPLSYRWIHHRRSFRTLLHCCHSDNLHNQSKTVKWGCRHPFNPMCLQTPRKLLSAVVFSLLLWRPVSCPP